MCIACLEYTKDKLTLSEFKAAFREMTEKDKAHAQEVQRLLVQYANDPEELKKHMRALLPPKS
jgi:rubrerythrin